MGVKKVTNIGGVIANATNNTDGTLTDHGKLNYSGELELKDIEDHNYNSSSGFNVSTTIGIPQKGTQEASTAPKGSTTVGVNRSGQETEQLTKATLGQGTVKNATDSTNRDINNTQEITRDQTIGMLDGSVTVDHRLLTEAGRKEIIQEQKDLPENFRQSTENLALALPDGEYKDKVLQTLNNVQASLVKMPEEMRVGGETLAENYAEYIKQGGEPKDFELMMNDPEILAGIKAVNDLNTIKNQAVVALMSQGLSQEQANNLVNQSESGVIDENGIRTFILETIKTQASAGIIVPNAKDNLAEFGQEQLDIDKTSNIVIDAVTKMGQIKQKVDQRIANSNINPEYVGLALGLVLGGPANLVKSEVIGRIFGDEIAAITDRLKTEGAAYLLNTDTETVETTLANKNLINQSGNETAKQLVDQLEWTKDGLGIASSIILGGVGGAAVSKSNTTKIEGKDVEAAKKSKINTIEVKVENSKKGTKEYEILNNPPANSSVVLNNGVEFKTNPYGYVEEIEFQPSLAKISRDSRQTVVGKKGENGDVGGHIQACSLGGTCDNFNLFPQNRNFNNSAYKKWENEMRTALKNGDRVGKVTVKFDRSNAANIRPDSLEIEYNINGRIKNKFFKNEAASK